MSHRRPAIAVLILCALVLALGHAWLAATAMREKSTTADELAHIVGGYTFNHWNDYRFHPENGLLPQRWQALPLSLGKAPAWPGFDSAHWRKSDVWVLGHAFFYEVGNDSARMLMAARSMNALFGAATVLLVFFWARALWGTAGAWVAGVLAALCPTMLAHSGLATSDMAMAFFLPASAGVFWLHLNDGRQRWRLASLLVFGLACVAKYTAVLLLPIFAVLSLLWMLHGGSVQSAGNTHGGWSGRLGTLVTTLLLHSAAAAGVIWAFFGFRYSAFNPALPAGEFNLPWEFLLSFGGAKAWAIQFCREWRLLPEGWLYGLAFVLKHAEARGAFLDGDYSIYGWVSFFPRTFAYKTPLSLMAAIVGAGILAALRWRGAPAGWLGRWLLRTAPLTALFAVYWAVSLTSHLNIGHRHILPTYPVLFIFCGLLGWAAERAWRRARAAGFALGGTVLLLLGWHAAVAARGFPHYLAYFNPWAGGSETGYRHLADSSLDWGQDLPALAKWLATNRHPGEPVYLSYFGTGEPANSGIDAVLMPRLPTFDRPRPWHWFEPGIYALSATMLQQVYMPRRGPWTLENERRYQELRANEAAFRSLKADPEGHPELMQGLTSSNWTRAWDLFEQLRFARLCHYLRAREPDAMPGYSILVYRLTQEELDAALNGSLRDLAGAVAKPPGRPRQ